MTWFVKKKYYKTGFKAGFIFITEQFFFLDNNSVGCDHSIEGSTHKLNFFLYLQKLVQLIQKFFNFDMFIALRA
jgi:hypothetical protein